MDWTPDLCPTHRPLTNSPTPSNPDNSAYPVFSGRVRSPFRRQVLSKCLHRPALHPASVWYLSVRHSRSKYSGDGRQEDGPLGTGPTITGPYSSKTSPLSPKKFRNPEVSLHTPTPSTTPDVDHRQGLGLPTHTELGSGTTGGPTVHLTTPSFLRCPLPTSRLGGEVQGCRRET